MPLISKIMLVNVVLICEVGICIIIKWLIHDVKNDFKGKKMLYPFCCKKCGSVGKYVLINKGIHVGLYCSNCYTWKKWIKKSKLWKYERKYNYE